MRPILAAFLVLVLCTPAAHAFAERQQRPLQLINRGHDSVVELAVSVAGQDRFRPLPLGAKLRGGGGTVALAVGAEGCLVDVRVRFGNGEAQVYPGLDLCRYRALRVRPAPRSGDGPVTASWEPLVQFSTR